MNHFIWHSKDLHFAHGLYLHFAYVLQEKNTVQSLKYVTFIMELVCFLWSMNWIFKDYEEVSKK
jgi:hypothetical protein